MRKKKPAERDLGNAAAPNPAPTAAGMFLLIITMEVFVC